MAESSVGGLLSIENYQDEDIKISINVSIMTPMGGEISKLIHSDYKFTDMYLSELKKSFKIDTTNLSRAPEDGNIIYRYYDKVKRAAEQYVTLSEPRIL